MAKEKADESLLAWASFGSPIRVDGSEQRAVNANGNTKLRVDEVFGVLHLLIEGVGRTVRVPWHNVASYGSIEDAPKVAAASKREDATDFG